VFEVGSAQSAPSQATAGRHLQQRGNPATASHSPAEFPPNRSAPLSLDAAAALRSLLELCLRVDRQLFQTNDANAAAGACDTMADLTNRTAELERSLSPLSADKTCKLRALLHEYSWDGKQFSRRFDMWNFTKFVNRLARHLENAGVPVSSSANPEVHDGEASESESNMDDLSTVGSVKLKSFRVMANEEQTKEDTEFTEIEKAMIDVGIEFAERCRENAATCFDLWQHIESTKQRVGTGTQAAVLGGARADSVASADDCRQLQALAARTNETYHIRMNWHQVRGTVLQGMMDVDIDALPASGDADDSVCCICFGAESTEVNPIVFCEGCNIAVHKYCYGVLYLSEEDWYCRKCESPMRNSAVTCQFCPIKDGAMKRTSDGAWAHSFCALWHPKIALRDASTTPIIKVPARSRVKAASSIGNAGPSISCSVCHETQTPLKKCQHPGCMRHYHPMCAWYDGNFVDVYDSARKQYELEMNIFCPDHVPAPVGRNAEQQKIWRNKDRADTIKKRRGKKISVEERARQQQVRARAFKPDRYPDRTCAVCYSAQPEDGNDVIQCSGCKLWCHQHCYGVPMLPARGAWRCNVCRAG
jgi:hypothetical protein